MKIRPLASAPIASQPIAGNVFVAILQRLLFFAFGSHAGGRTMRAD